MGSLLRSVRRIPLVCVIWQQWLSRFLSPLDIEICMCGYLGLGCEAPIPYAAGGQEGGKGRPGRRRSAVTCLARARRQDLNGETVAVSRGMIFPFM